MNRFLFLALLIIFIGSCATMPRDILSISTLNSQREMYDGAQVTLRGYLLAGPEPIAITAQQGNDDDYWSPSSGCLSLVNYGDLDSDAGTKYNDQYVEIEGIFRKNTDSYGISFTHCGSTGLDIGGDVEGSIHILDKPQGQKPRAGGQEGRQAKGDGG